MMRISRMLKMTSRFVLSRVPPCDVPQGYASVVPFPAALLGCHFEHPARVDAVPTFPEL